MTETFHFDRFVLIPDRRELAEDGRMLKVGSRAFDLLCLLVTRAGELVSRDEAMAHVWPGLHVDEGGLRVHMAALRKLLGDGSDGRRFIVNEPGRGYRFVAPVTRGSDAYRRRAAPPGRLPPPSPALPAPRSRLIGRVDTVGDVDHLLARYPLVTIAGPGGIGKTTVALAYAERAAASAAVDVIDFGGVADPAGVPNTVAAAIGLPVRSPDETAAIVRALQAGPRLLVLDCCEHVIDAVAALAERILDATPGVRLLATSREPLRISGEYVHRLGPLAVPPVGIVLTRETVVDFPAADLFLERTIAATGDDAFTAEDLDAVTAICRRLDGVALALELAAAAVPLYGVRGLAERLAESFSVLTRGRRTALPRHRTLRLTIAWSVDLLAAEERGLLARLSVIPASFDRLAAAHIGGDEHGGVDRLAGLVEKSLLIVDPAAAGPRYRMLDSTRAFARELLVASGEERTCLVRLAEHWSNRLGNFQREHPSEPLTSFRPDLEAVRAALHFAVSPDGYRSIAIRLAAAAAPLFLDLSLLVECTRWAETALALVTADDPPETILTLRTAFAAPRLYTHGNLAEVRASLEEALASAAAAGDPSMEVHILDVLYVFHLRVADFRGIREIADRTAAVIERAHGLSGIEANWMAGLAAYFAGEHAAATPHLRRSLDILSPTRRVDVFRYGSDRRVHAHNALARSLWMQGYPDDARRLAARNLAEAADIGHPVGHSIALMWMTPIFLWTGEHAIAEACARDLIALARRSSQRPAELVGEAFLGILDGRHGAPDRAVTAIASSIDGLLAVNNRLLHVILLGHLAEAHLLAGRAGDALATVEEAVARAAASGDLVTMPWLKILSARALALAAPAGSGLAGALDDALAWARRQGARAYLLEIATLRAELGLPPTVDREEGLEALLGSFEQGRDTEPLRRATRVAAARSGRSAGGEAGPAP
ncbi:ATP-binding protein [Methylobrevis pamukkalensis]|uniref:Putative HTH-type transcriptional regulator n=1 Tax=Methylobrevis pamukkalensis TaxID=1439726 RepID=A0A1E3H7N4_9HYPH|nr:winged helix-turn-helix domain-containing protein [Methylobrevis pamukkalensis]ODN71521.1 putative HTH-type transcriptional regulator [Methylobrevis pamukkalensis]